MFIDEVKIKLISGKGGDGLISWRREKYIPKGGPWGGNGGKGGDIYLISDENINTLSEYRYKKVIKAQSGEKGKTNTMNGSNATNLYLKVPLGTIVRDLEKGTILADLSQKNSKILVVKGGKGGYGNAHFVSSTRQAPGFAELGDQAEEIDLHLELKLVAEIGIIGIPSSGKSSLISAITNLKAKVGDYPFTTLVPNLGILDHKGKSLVLADLPGLIPGASRGKGLGIEFLKHTQRTQVLLHILDLSRLDNIFQDYKNIRKELENFSKNLSKKQEIIIFSKSDLLDEETKNFIILEFKKIYKRKKVLCVSSFSKDGIEEIKDFLIQNFVKKQETDNKDEFEKIKIFDLKKNSNPKKITLDYIGNYTFNVFGERLEQIIRMTDFSNLEALNRVYDILEKVGVIKKIEESLIKICDKNKLDKNLFFQGNEDDFLSPKLIISNKEINLDRFKFIFNKK